MSRSHGLLPSCYSSLSILMAVWLFIFNTHNAWSCPNPGCSCGLPECVRFQNGMCSLFKCDNNPVYFLKKSDQKSETEVLLD